MADTSVSGFEAPLNADPVTVSTVLPDSDFAVQCLAVGKAPVQTLSPENTQLDLHEAQRVTQLGRAVNFQPLRDASGFRRLDRLAWSRVGVSMFRLSISNTLG